MDIEQIQKQNADLLLALQAVAGTVQQFKNDWMRVPYFANRVNKAIREAISLAHGQIINLDAVGGPLDLSKYDNPTTADAGGLSGDLDALVREYGNAPVIGPGRTRRMVMREIYSLAGEIFGRRPAMGVGDLYASIGAYLAQRTVLDTATAFRCAEDIAAMVLPTAGGRDGAA